MNLEQQLRKMVKPSRLYKEIHTNNRSYLQCLACAHQCKIAPGKKGICQVRFNEDGKLYVPYGYIASWQVDPIEKKPFFHAYPGASALSYGMLGCDLHCSYCQNWQISQTLRDENAGTNPIEATPEQIVDSAIRFGARAVVSTYNEPLITSEWSRDVFELAKKNGLATGYVSNGNATPEVLDFIRPVTDLYKIDLKTFNDKNYRALGTSLEKVLNGIKEVYKRKFWLEIVTLLIPGFNDSPEEIHQMAEFLADISTDIPWHITAFHPDYKMNDKRYTSAKDLIKAGTIAKEHGIKFVYLGNIRGLEDWENTICPNCNTTLIRRDVFRIKDYAITEKGTCPECNTKIPGIWEKPSERISDLPFVVRF
ncbi:MAG: AmmeMemoRadiSam system radical SAM enzyme [Methanobacteriota archaeon]|nr:MAG: AmmeMemoRadiSam system radical SAM enzyme [Euryarchaeota archaeon]